MGSASWLSTGEGLRPVGESGPEEGGSTGGTVPETQADLRYLLPSEPCGFEATYLELASAVKEQYPGIEIESRLGSTGEAAEHLLSQCSKSQLYHFLALALAVLYSAQQCLAHSKMSMQLE